MADIIGISQRSVSNYENNLSRPTLDQFGKLLKALDLDLAKILAEIGFQLNQSIENATDHSGMNVFNNQSADKLIEQYEQLIKEKNDIIKAKDQHIQFLEHQLKEFSRQ